MKKKEKPAKAPKKPAPPKPAPVKAKQEARMLRKAAGIKAARMVLWIILAFIFIRGVAAIARSGSTESAVTQLQSRYEAEAAEQARVEGLLPFAEGFAREYLTYSPSGDDDYKSRLSQYAVSAVYDGIRLRSGSAEALYARAYRSEAYSESQYDVWVRLNVRYTTEEENPDTGDVTQAVATKQTVLKVPVAIVGDRYVIEDTPAFVTDTEKADTYERSGYSGTGADRETEAAVEETLTDFFSAYYSDRQSVIKYYLTADADPDTFLGLQDRVQFSQMTDCRVYVLEEPGAYLAVVTLEVTDDSGLTVPQHFNLRLDYKDGQYYIQSMDVRSKNLNVA